MRFPLKCIYISSAWRRSNKASYVAGMETSYASTIAPPAFPKSSAHPGHRGLIQMTVPGIAPGTTLLK
jgi:hypothetical protein